MYLVLEIQTLWNGQVSFLPIAPYEDLSEAMSRYYSILASAELSNLPKHTAMVFTEEGFVVASKCCKRDTPKVEITE